MTERENLLRLVRRQGYDHVPADFGLCPALREAFERETGRIPGSDSSAMAYVPDAICESSPGEAFASYYRGTGLKPGTTFDEWGVASEPVIYHLVNMRHPLSGAKSEEEIDRYPFPAYTDSGFSAQTAAVKAAHAAGLAAVGHMQMTIWERAWYLRGMEQLMLDMLDDEPIAQRLFDEVTDRAVFRARQFAKAGCDILYLGDDVGTQHSLLMSQGMYREHIKPRLKAVIDAARCEKLDILVFYHSCGYVLPLIEDFIEAGVDVLNPIQPESMDFQEIHRLYGDRLSFLGGIGTQTTMPFGTPEDVRERTYELLRIAGPKGGVLPAPTHLLEPEVPLANVLAYLDALKSWGNGT